LAGIVEAFMMRRMTVYSAEVWTGLGRSYWRISCFASTFDMAQCHRVYERETYAPRWFLELVAIATNDEAHIVDRWARELRLI